MLSSILCVMRPIHSVFCLLIVKMYAPVLKGCLIDVSLFKQWLLDSFVRCLTPSYYSYLRLKGLIKCLCAPLNVTISPEQQASFEQKLFSFFLCIREERKAAHAGCNTENLSKTSIRKVTGKEFWEEGISGGARSSNCRH